VGSFFLIAALPLGYNKTTLRNGLLMVLFRGENDEKILLRNLDTVYD